MKSTLLSAIFNFWIKITYIGVASWVFYRSAFCTTDVTSCPVTAYSLSLSSSTAALSGTNRPWAPQCPCWTRLNFKSNLQNSNNLMEAEYSLWYYKAYSCCLVLHIHSLLQHHRYIYGILSELLLRKSQGIRHILPMVSKKHRAEHKLLVSRPLYIMSIYC